MEVKKKRSRKAKSDALTSETTIPKNGTITGEYSKATWNNGELVNFDIDWNKLSEIFKTMRQKND